jgi:hypothetical protein
VFIPFFSFPEFIVSFILACEDTVHQEPVQKTCVTVRLNLSDFQLTVFYMLVSMIPSQGIRGVSKIFQTDAAIYTAFVVL